MNESIGSNAPRRSTSALLKQKLSVIPPTVRRGKGIFLYDSEGRDYLDASGGAMTVAIGHGVPEIIAAIASQAQKVCFTFRTQFTSEPAEELATLLSQLAPGDVDYVMFVNSGSEATELAIRTAVQYWREMGRPEKTHVLGRSVSYHGMTMGALSMSGHAVRRRDYGDLLHSFDVGPTPRSWELPPAERQSEVEEPAEWIRAIEAHGPDKVAALIVEPIIGAAGGVLVPPAGHLRELRRISDRFGILLIVDEVITACGRTGRWFACDHDDVVPDMIAIGKGMTSGYAPMAALLLREKVVEAMRAGSGAAPFAHTFSGNPLSAATSLAVLKYMRSNDVIGNANARSPELEAGLIRLEKKYPCIANVRGRGMLWGFDLIDATTDKEGAGGASLTSDFVSDCFQSGLVVYPAGFGRRSAVIVSPPLTITWVEIDLLLCRLDAAMLRFSERLRHRGSGEPQST